MPDQKISGLTADTAPTGDDLLVLVNDPAGTPGNKKATVAAVVGAMIASGEATLSTHTPNNLSLEQWATEEVTIAQADAPAAAVVIATLDGTLSPNTTSGTPAVGDRGAARLEVSFDGGGSYASMGAEVVPTLALATSTANDFPFSRTYRLTGTVTGSIKVRAMCRDGTQANDCIFESGRITVLVHPQ